MRSRGEEEVQGFLGDELLDGMLILVQLDLHEIVLYIGLVVRFVQFTHD